MGIQKAVTLLFVALLTVACTAKQPPAQVQYTPESWKTMIPETCTHFFDGCNKCTRAEGAEMAACTRMACMEYKKPVCLDAPEE